MRKLGVYCICAAVLAPLGAAPAWDQPADRLMATVSGGAPPPTVAPGLSTSFLRLSGVAADSAGNIYISAEEQNAVFLLDRDGKLSRVAGAGAAGYSGDGGPAASAQLNLPRGIAVDAAGALYIADAGNCRIRKVGTDGVIVTVAGTGVYGHSPDGGRADQTELTNPSAVAVDSTGALYIADTFSHRIRKVSADGILTTIVGTGVAGTSGDGGPATQAMLDTPRGVAVDAAGAVYIGAGNSVRKVAPGGVISTVAGGAACGAAGDGGPATSAQLCYPSGVAVESTGTFYIADTENCRIRKVSDGVISSVGGSNRCGAGAAFSDPLALALDPGGNLIVADRGHRRVQKLTPSGVASTIAGGGVSDHAAAAWGQLLNPTGMAQDAAGNLYIADTGHNRIRKISPDGVISTVAGTGVDGYSGNDGPALAADLSIPAGVAVDRLGALYIADTGNDRIRKVAPNGLITTFAGGGDADPGDGEPGGAARLLSPAAVAVDASGNLYVSTPRSARVRKVSRGGTITTLAGNGLKGLSGDGGPATEARLNEPLGLAVDGSGAVYIADSKNGRIRKVAADGTITTVASSLDNPAAVAVDGSGTLYISEPARCRVRMVAPGGAAADFAGSGTCGYSGDGQAASQARLNAPLGLLADSSGAVYIADAGNNAVRVATAGPVLTVQASHAGVFTRGLSGAAYTVTVGNAPSAAPSSGLVTLTAALTEGVTLVSMAGAGWSCVANSCTRGDALGGGASFPPVTVTVNVAPDAPSQVTAQFSASGGGGAPGRASVFDPIAAAGSRPAITAVASGASFLPGVVDGSWVSILGSNLAGSTRTWRGDEIVNGALPTSLDGVSVTVNGLPAAIHYISPSQINLQAPATGATGSVNVTVANSLGQATVSAPAFRNSPALFLVPQGGGRYPAAQFLQPGGGLGYLGPAGLFGDAAFTRPAKPGELIVLWGTGLGPTNPAVPPGRVFSGAARLVDNCTVTVGGLEARVEFAGVSGAGLYQLNVTLPASLPAGEQPLVVTVNGASSQEGVVLPVAP